LLELRLAGRQLEVELDVNAFGLLLDGIEHVAAAPDVRLATAPFARDPTTDFVVRVDRPSSSSCGAAMTTIS
jgi:hypothetical protein